MTVTLVSNATVDAATFIYVAEHGLTNMRNAAAITVVGTMPSSTVNGHDALGDGAAVDSYLSAQINGAVAANQSYSCILVGTFTTSTDSAKPAMWASGSAACRPKIVGNYASGRQVSGSSSYAGLNQLGTVPSDSWTTGSQLSIIVGRKTSAGMAGSLNNAATVDGYNDATIRAATLASTDSLYFGGSPVVGGGETAQAGFAVSMCAFFVGVSPEELRTYIGADPWADKIVTIGSGDQTLTPGLFTNTNAFYAPTVTYDQTLTPGLYTNTNAFYSATVSLSGGSQSLTPGLFSNANTFHAATVARVPGFLTPVLKNNTGTVLASETGVACNVYNSTTGALVVRKTGLTSSAAGIVSVTDAAMAAGTTYSYEIVLTGARRLPTAVA